jgi:hypothetical protein
MHDAVCGGTVFKSEGVSGFMDCDFGESLACVFRSFALLVTAIGRQNTGGTVDASQTKDSPVLHFPFGGGDIRSRETKDSLAIFWESRRQKIQQLLCAVATTGGIVRALWKGNTREQSHVHPIQLAKCQDHQRNIILGKLWSKRLNVESPLNRFRSHTKAEGQQRRRKE